MEKQTLKTKKILIITLICVIFIASIIIGLLFFNDSDVIEDRPTSNDINNTEIEVDSTEEKDHIEDDTQEENEDIDNLDEEKYSVIFLDSDGQILQSSYFKKGTTPFYSGKSLTRPGHKFNTWIPSITTVYGNQAYIATYSYESSTTHTSSSESGSQPAPSTTYASIIYKDMTGTQQTLFFPSGTTINFDAGEHGTYDSVPTSVILTDNQQLDITDSSYNPSIVEVNYIFKGFSCSGNTMKCEYALADNIVNVECKQISGSIIKNNVIYIKHDYIKGTGTQYIDTGINRAENSKYDFEFQIDVKSSISYTNIWGCDERERTAQAYDKLYVYTQNGSDTVRLGDKTNYGKAIYSLVIGQKYHFEIGGGKAKMNGVESSGVQWTSANNSDCLFWTRIQDTSNQDCLNGKFYYYKTWKDSDLKLDLIPIERVSDGEIGMLNTIDGVFYQNKGTGKFQNSGNKIMPGTNAGKIMASGSYTNGSSLTLTAVANDGYRFVGWSDNNTNAERTITIGDNTVYTALFEHD